MLVKCRGVIKNKGCVEHVVNLSLVQFELHVCCSYTASFFLVLIFQEFQVARRPNRNIIVKIPAKMSFQSRYIV